MASQLCEAKTVRISFDIVTAFYKRYGVGKFGLNKAFRVVHTGDEMVLSPITHTSDVTLDELIGYELQKKAACGKYGGICRGTPCEQLSSFWRQWNRKIDMYQGNLESILRKGTPVN